MVRVFLSCATPHTRHTSPDVGVSVSCPDVGVSVSCPDVGVGVSCPDVSIGLSCKPRIEGNALPRSVPERYYPAGWRLSNGEAMGRGKPRCKLDCFADRLSRVFVLFYDMKSNVSLCMCSLFSVVFTNMICALEEPSATSLRLMDPISLRIAAYS